VVHRRMGACISIYRGQLDREVCQGLYRPIKGEAGCLY
jgi:hypothetical protein